MCTTKTNFTIIFNLLKFFLSYVLRISALDLLSYRIPEATGLPTVRWLRIPGKHKSIWRSLYLEMIIKKKKVHQSINQLKNNQKIRENLVWLGRFVSQKKGLNIFKKLLVELSFLHTIRNQSKIYIRVTKKTHAIPRIISQMKIFSS